MGLLLKKITIRDFRSLRGEISVELDAPVVLIHGQNGVGKTSLLSAIELGLTGDTLSLRRIDPAILKYLPHRDAPSGNGTIVLESDYPRPQSRSEISISTTAIRGTALLGERETQFFNERCYLAQTTLSRLLEIYQQPEAQQADSALTKFVKELLGLYRYDSLINGLRAAGDIRRLREPAPLYWSARSELNEIQTSIEGLTKQRAELTAQAEAHALEAVQQLDVFDPAKIWHPLDVVQAKLALESSDREAELSKIAQDRRRMIDVSDQLSLIMSTAAELDRQAVESKASATQIAFQQWEEASGASLAQTIGDVERLVTISAIWPERPDTLLQAAVQAARSEVSRIDKMLLDHSSISERTAELDNELAATRARIEALNEQIDLLSGPPGSFVEILSGLASHIHNDNCPVCDRNFSEVSRRSLSEHVAGKIASLIEAAGRFQELTRERASSTETISAAQRELYLLTASLLPLDQVETLKVRRDEIDELRIRLEEFTEEAKIGMRLAIERAEAAAALSGSSARDRRMTWLTSVVDEVERDYGGNTAAKLEDVEDRIGSLVALLASREDLLSKQQRARAGAITHLSVVEALRAELANSDAVLITLTERRKNLMDAKAIADRRLAVVRGFASRVRTMRAKVVREAFNEDLNAVWKDLFVRLAPDEKFVPAFALPDADSESVEALLETHYRSGGRGGNPRAMLSAGNLNTAALTLFLALHLSVQPVLPCLIIDDPVQSMDEVHISQMAALLRTLSKQKGKQIVVAVHERSLFEYLALELSPAYSGDRLITIELGRAADGVSTARWETKTYEPDKAIAA